MQPKAKKAIGRFAGDEIENWERIKDKTILAIYQNPKSPNVIYVLSHGKVWGVVGTEWVYARGYEEMNVYGPVGEKDFTSCIDIEKRKLYDCNPGPLPSSWRIWPKY